MQSGAARLAIDDTPLGPEHFDEPIFAHLRRDYVPIDVRLTVGEALAHLRSQQLGQRIIYFYVVNEDGRLEGIVPTRRLLMSDPATPVSSIMVTDVVTMPTWSTVRDACDMFMKYRFLAFPVVDEARRLHGIADVGLFTREMAELAGRQGADDVFQLIGIHLVQGLGPWSGFKDRFPWLLTNVAGGLMAAFVTSRYQALLDAVVVLALFIPIVLALAESVSIQSVTVALLTLHGRRPTWAGLGRTVGREVVVGVLLGALAGLVVGLVALAWKGSGRAGLSLFLGIGGGVAASAVIGLALPFVLRLLRRDPQLAAGPIALAASDMVTLYLYFNLGRWLLL